MKQLAAFVLAASAMTGIASAQEVQLQPDVRIAQDRAAYCFAANYQITNAMEYTIFSTIPQEERAAVTNDEEFTALMKKHLSEDAEKMLRQQQEIAFIWASLYKVGSPEASEEEFDNAVTAQMAALQQKGEGQNINFDTAVQSQEAFTATVNFLQAEARKCYDDLSTAYPELVSGPTELPLQ